MDGEGLKCGTELVQVDALDRVAVVTLNRPEALNALNDELIGELNAELVKLDHHDEVGAIVLTGSIKSFAGKSAALLIHFSFSSHHSLHR